MSDVRVTPEQVRTYLLARGWEDTDRDHAWYHMQHPDGGRSWMEIPRDPSYADYACRMDEVLALIFTIEGRMSISDAGLMSEVIRASIPALEVTS